VRMIEPVIIRTLFPQRTFLDKCRLQFMERMTRLQDLKDLQTGIIAEVRETLGYGKINLVLFKPEGPAWFNSPEMSEGLSINIFQGAEKSLHLLERHLPEEWPKEPEIRSALPRLFRETGAEAVIPFVRDDQILAMMFLSDREKDQGLSAEEIGYLKAVMAGGGIALANSMMFQNIADLKDRLERQAQKLQHEIVEREEAQESLQESERQYRLLAENVKDIVWTLDLSTLHLSYISPSVEQVLGFTSDEQMKMELGQILTPKSFNQAVRILAEELEKENNGTLTLTDR